MKIIKTFLLTILLFVFAFVMAFLFNDCGGIGIIIGLLLLFGFLFVALLQI